MVMPTNGTAKKYLAIMYMLAATTFIVVDKLIPKRSIAEQVSINTTRLSVLETQYVNLDAQVRLGRAENKEEHNIINTKLDAIIIRK